MHGRLAAAILRRRGAVSVAILAVLVVSVLGALRLRVDFSSEAFYGDDDPRRAALARMVEAFGPDDDTLVAIVDAGPSGDVLTAKTLANVDELARAAAAAPHVRGVRSLPDELARRGIEISPLIRSTVLASNAVPLLVSSEARWTAIIVRLDRSTDDLLSAIPIVEAVQSTMVREARRTGLDLGFAGVPALRAAFFASVLHDQRIFAPLTFGLIGLGLAFAFRRRHAVMCGLVAAGVPTLMLAGALGWTGTPIGLLNQIDFTLIPVLSVAAAVHVITRVHELAAPGQSTDDQVIAAMASVGVPCTFATLTTAAGFVSLAAVPMPVLREFGIWAALGMTFVLLTALVVVPLILASSSLAPLPRQRSAALGRLARLAMRHRLAVLAAAGVAVAIFIVGARRVQVDNRLGSLLDSAHPVSVASSILDTRLGGTLALEVVGPRTSSGQLGALGERARGLPGVRAVVGPEIAGEAARVSLRTMDHGARAFTTLESSVRALIETSAEHDAGFALTGTASVAYAGVDRIAGSLRTSLLLAVALVTILMAVAFRSLRLVLIAAVPNALPLLVGYGMLGWMGRSLDPVPAVVLVLALGIAVDDTIHLLARAREGLAAGMSAPDAVAAAAETAGRAVTITTVAVIGGLAVNLAASFPALVLLGALGSAVLAAAWVADLVVLPALLSGWMPRA